MKQWCALYVFLYSFEYFILKITIQSSIFPHSTDVFDAVIFHEIDDMCVGDGFLHWRHNLYFSAYSDPEQLGHFRFVRQLPYILIMTYIYHN